MSQARFDTYFHRRAGRFSSFYRSEPVSRVLGRGALFDRMAFAVEMVGSLDAARVLDVGCGSGPLFTPLAERGVHVTGIDPAAAMVALARQQAALHPDLVTVEQRGWEQIDERDAYDVAVALGVYDYVDDAAELLRRMSLAAPHVVASLPSPGLRTDLRKWRYGARGVHVHGYASSDIDALADQCGLVVAERRPLGNAGFAVHFTRR